MKSHSTEPSKKASKPVRIEDRVLVDEMEKLAAGVRYWDIPLRSALFVRDPRLEIVLSSSKSYLDAIGTNKLQMVSNHPQRRLLDPKVIELEVDALIALRDAHIALIGKKPTMAKKLIRQAKGLIDQSNAANPASPLDPRSRGGKTAATMRQALMKPIIAYCAREISDGDLTDLQVGSQSILAEELVKRVKLHFHDQFDQLPPITFSTMIGLLKPATHGKETNLVRKAYDARVKVAQKSSLTKSES